jgi:anaerobic selenocysteine-containing dehydrogenase
MNDATPIDSAARDATAVTAIGHSACPHDCPSTCALEVDLLAHNRIGRVRGDADNSYTAGVICAKVARYAERIHHPDRLLKPLIRSGAKGEGQWKEASFEAALDLIAEKFEQAEAKFGSETVWLNYYAGTMGLVQRDGIHRLRHAKRYSNQFDSFCTNMAWTGFAMGAGAMRGSDPREMAKSDCVVIWGTNAVSTQVNVMTHAIRARKERGAKIVVIDIYDTPTMKQADIKVLLKPGTDGAFACAVMHVLFREGLADRDYLNKFSDDPAGLESHLKDRTPEWAEAICGVPVAEIEAFARLVGTTKRTFFRLGYGFTRQRNGAVNMHAALSLAVCTGSYQYEGGGAFHSNSDIFRLDKSLLEGRRHFDPGLRWLDQSKIGRILTADAEALGDGPPVTAMLVQNTNPANVAPEQRKVIEGLKREDLFLAVHEQFMTDTAQLADVVLPATMFLEHDDIYRGGGHQHIVLGPEAGRSAGRSDVQSSCRRGAWKTPWRCRPRRLRPDRAPAHRHDAAKTGPGRLRTASRLTNGPTSSPISKPRISSPALPTRMASTASGPTGPERRLPTSRPGAWGRKGQSTGCPSFPIMSN